MNMEHNQNPLDLMQLHQMDGHPIWIEDLANPERSAWRLIYWDRGKYLVLISKTEVAYLLDEYGKTWLAYDFEPDELRARAEAAEARCTRLEEARENANDAAAKWEGKCKILEQRMDAIMKLLPKIDIGCELCSNVCDTSDCDCIECRVDCKCRHCNSLDGQSNWQFVGWDKVLQGDGHEE